LAVVSSFVVELVVFLISDRSHLLTHYLFGMGDSPFSHSPLQGSEASVIEARLFSL
jgi:hypothetical protein